ncbi:MAG: hypothetical protein WBD55_13115 [Dehalococcoidia bacterium]
MRHPVRLSLLVCALALVVPSAATAKAKRPKTPEKPQVKILGFTTYVRVGIPAIQAKPGKTITQCYEGYNGQREVNVVWQGWGIPKGTKMGIALWGGPPSAGSPTEPSDADTMKNNGFKWSHKKSEKVQVPYGYTFAGGPFGPQQIDGDWFVKVLIKGKAVVRKKVTIACQ